MNIRSTLLAAALLLALLPVPILRAGEPMRMESPQQVEIRAAKIRKWADVLEEMASKKEGEVAATMRELAENLNETADQTQKIAQALRKSDYDQIKEYRRSLPELHQKQEALRKRLLDLGMDLKRSDDANHPQSPTESSAENRSKSPNRTAHSPDELRQWLDDTEPPAGK